MINVTFDTLVKRNVFKLFMCVFSFFLLQKICFVMFLLILTEIFAKTNEQRYCLTLTKSILKILLKASPFSDIFFIEVLLSVYPCYMEIETQTLLNVHCSFIWYETFYISHYSMHDFRFDLTDQRSNNICIQVKPLIWLRSKEECFWMERAQSTPHPLKLHPEAPHY